MQARRLMKVSKRKSSNTQSVVGRGNGHKRLVGTDKFKLHGHRR
jgi:hypothetical protein